MTDAPKPPGGPPPEDIPEVVAEAATKVARKIGWPGLIIIVSVSLVVLIAVLLGGVRFGAITPPISMSTGVRPSCSTAASMPTRSPPARSWSCAVPP